MAPGLVEEILAWIGNAIAAIIDKLYNGVAAILDWIVALVEGIGNILWQALADMFAVLQEGLAAILSSIEETLTSIVDAVWQFLQNAWETIQELTIGVLDTISNYISDLWAQLEAFIAEALDTVVEWIGQAVDYIQGVVDAGIEWVKQVGTAAIQALEGVVSNVSAVVEGIIAQIVATLNAAWEQLVTGAEAIIVAIGEKLQGLREAFADAATQIVTSIGDLAEDQIGPIRDSIKDFMAAYLPADDPATTKRALTALEGIHTNPQQMANYRAWWESEWRSLADSGPIRKTIFLGAMFLLSVIPTIMGISQTLSQPAIQEYSRQFPYQILAPADATAAWRRGLITEGEAVGEIRRAGFDERKAGFIVKLTSLVPAEQDLVQMLWRGILDPNSFDNALQQRGFDPPWRGRIKEAAELIPPVQDLIQMAIRDVWNPAAVSQGRLTDAFPEELGEWTQKQGLSPEWALKYWAAHWRLPSTTQAFEMRHRDVIDDAQLDTLLQALDIAPGWRGPLKSIAFNPYTRVDVRRMHQVGVLDEEGVFRAYLDLGYDEDKARGLTEFTKILNEPRGAEDDEELGKLSRTAILGFYGDGVLSRERAAQLLETAGHTPEAAQLYLNAADADAERADRKTETALIIELAEAGTLAWDEAEDRLRSLGLETKEVERAVTKLLRAQQRKTKLPSKADADRFYEAGLLQRAAYLDLLARLGYSQKWAQMYLQLAEVKRGQG